MFRSRFRLPGAGPKRSALRAPAWSVAGRLDREVADGELGEPERIDRRLAACGRRSIRSVIRSLMSCASSDCDPTASR